MTTTNTILMYSTTWCGDCRRAKNFFTEYGIDFTEINIEQEPDAVDIVRRLNGGYQSVPTILFPDGSVLVEPSNRQLAEKTGVDLDRV